MSANEQPGGPADQSSHEFSIRDPQLFIATYTQLLDDDDCHNDELNKIHSERDLVTQEIERQQKRLAKLRDDEERVEKERKRGKNKQDHLHHGLSEGERALLAYGIKLGSRSNKRAKTAEDDVAD